MDEDYKIDLFAAMEQYGGSFAKALAKAWTAADHINKTKIETVWVDMIANYTKFVKEEK